MTLLEIPYNDWSKDKLRKNRKTATTRTKKYGKVGDRFSVGLCEASCPDFCVVNNPGHTKTYQITKIRRTTLDIVAKYHYHEEGCASRDEFITVWNEIHPGKGFDPFQKVWFHKFREVKT